MGIVGGFQILKSRNYIVRTFITPIYLNLELMIAYTQLYRKYILSLRSSSLYGAFQKTFLSGLFSGNGFNSMLNLGLYFLRVLVAYKIYTDFVPCKLVQNNH